MLCASKPVIGKRARSSLVERVSKRGKRAQAPAEPVSSVMKRVQASPVEHVR
ncbi:hypothetical protein NDS46_19135 [Paenibacillus thiaminolyticus]|uniref:hypothetical protein n=1 Tax=Paenibacillus thiaminolyticus TaxID=49283 RepID=UPI00232F70E5|nr:hypothetical protein [Paenibacillus thiaminolyticus]WCF06462.1 hypothetical protein NDS46_19135 [Paenibacillus thiaminolyticus]